MLGLNGGLVIDPSGEAGESTTLFFLACSSNMLSIGFYLIKGSACDSCLKLLLVPDYSTIDK